jgi:2-(1,2-epoxy-1,2-dihydrophenyl)acetyl-CoA isomerase
LNESPVSLLRDGAVAILSIERPEALNALDVPTAQAFHAACRSLADDAGVRAVIVRGEGRCFGVGGDLAAMRGDATAVADRLIESMHAAVMLLTAMDAPVIASLQGAVAGGSMSLACACDLAIAAEGTTFNLAYTRIGASSDLSSSWHLPRLVGLRSAMQIALLSDSFDAADAMRLGLVNRVVPAADLQRETLALAQRLASGPTLAYGRLKRLLRQAFENDLATQLAAEAEQFRASTRTDDFAEGIAAFLAKRPPLFTGADPPALLHVIPSIGEDGPERLDPRRGVSI